MTALEFFFSFFFAFYGRSSSLSFVRNVPELELPARAFEKIVRSLSFFFSQKETKIKNMWEQLKIFRELFILLFFITFHFFFFISQVKKKKRENGKKKLWNFYGHPEHTFLSHSMSTAKQSAHNDIFSWQFYRKFV